MEKRYSFKVPIPSCKGLSAEQAALELETIRKKYGDLKPQYVVAESKKKGSYLHDYFEWDNKKAADKWRIEQARWLLRNINVEIIHNEVSAKVRAFVHVREEKKLPRNYVPIQEAIINDQAYQDLLEQSKEDMENFISTYSQITELNGVKAEMLKVLNG